MKRLIQISIFWVFFLLIFPLISLFNNTDQQILVEPEKNILLDIVGPTITFILMVFVSLTLFFITRWVNNKKRRN
jgi:hypothetical protein